MLNAEAKTGNGGSEVTLPSHGVDMGQVRKSLRELETLYKRAQQAKDAYADAIDGVSTSAGVKAATLKKFIAARMKDKVHDAHAQAAQLKLLFDEV